MNVGVFLLLVLTASASLFTEPGEMTHFRKEADFHLSLYRADLVLDIDLHAVTESIDITCDLLTFFKGKLRKAGQQLHHLCGQEQRSWHSIVDFVTGDVEPRRPRFILAALFTSVVAGVGGYLWGQAHSTSQTDRQLLENQDSIVQVLRRQEHSGAVTSENLKRLAKIVSKAEDARLSEEHTLEGAIIILAAFLYRAHEIGNLLRATETLILHQQLSPTLISPGVLAEKLSHLRQQAELQDRDLSISQEIDVFKCSVSISTSATHYLRVVVHIPVHNKGDLFSLYTYLSVPTLVSGKMVRLSAISQPLLGVRRDQSGYLLPSENDISSCIRFQTGKSCTFAHSVLRPAFPSCLWGLYTANGTTITRHCRFSLVPNHPQFWRISPLKFLVFHPDSLLFVLACEGTVKEQLVFQGTRLIEVPKGCVGRNNYFSLFASHLVAREDVHLQVPPLNLSASELTHHEERNLSALSRLLSDVSQVVHEPQAQIPEVEFPHHALSVTSVAICVVSVLVLLLILLALFLRSRKLLAALTPDASK